jgi:hypothetical protein
MEPGFFELKARYARLDAHGDPLLAIKAAVPFEMFRAKLKTALIKGGLYRWDADRKSGAGRKPWDEVLILKVLVLQVLDNLSDEATEYYLRDRLSFMRFVGLGLEDTVPDAKTLWLYRATLVKTSAMDALFDPFDGYLKAKEYLAMGRQIIDATIVAAPRQRNSRDDNGRSRRAKLRRNGKNNPQRTSTRTRTRAGRRSTGARTLATRTMSASTGSAS